jgi:hypothetical protein
MMMLYYVSAGVNQSFIIASSREEEAENDDAINEKHKIWTLFVCTKPTDYTTNRDHRRWVKNY